MDQPAGLFGDQIGAIGQKGERPGILKILRNHIDLIGRLLNLRLTGLIDAAVGVGAGRACEQDEREQKQFAECARHDFPLLRLCR